MHLSKTRYWDFIQCPRKFYFSEIISHKDDGVSAQKNKTSLPLIRHEIVRENITHYLAGEDDLDPITVEASVENKLTKYGFEPGSVNSEVGIILNCINQFVDNSDDILDNYSVDYLYSGQPNEFIYKNTTFMCMPEIVLKADDHLRILSLKTGQSNYWNEEEYKIKASNLIFWARSAKKHFHEIAVEDIYLREGCNKISLDISDDELSHILYETSSIREYYAKSRDERHFPAHPSYKSCRFCSYDESCGLNSFNEYLDYDYDFSVHIPPFEPVNIEEQIFLSHDSNDKQGIVRPFARALEAQNIPSWLDEININWGASLVENLSNAISHCKYSVCFLSKGYIEKVWAHAEMKALLMKEMQKKESKILPIMINKNEAEFIFEKIPFLSDKKYLTWDQGLPTLITQLKLHLKKNRKK